MCVSAHICAQNHIYVLTDAARGGRRRRVRHDKSGNSVYVTHIYAHSPTYMLIILQEGGLLMATVQMVVKDRKLFTDFLQFWLEHLPDVSDYPEITPSQLQFWMRLKKKSRKKPHRYSAYTCRHVTYMLISYIRTARIRAAHRKFEGLCAQYLNEAIDFAISMNLWPVKFVSPDGTKSELVTEFCIGVWAKYCSRMVSYATTRL